MRITGCRCASVTTKSRIAMKHLMLYLFRRGVFQYLVPFVAKARRQQMAE